MGKQVSGPDWLDGAVFARTLEKTHDCQVLVLAEPVGLHAGDGWRLNAVATSRVLCPEGPSWSVAASLLWPSINHKELTTALYALLLQLDFLATRRSYHEAVKTT